MGKVTPSEWLWAILAWSNRSRWHTVTFFYIITVIGGLIVGLWALLGDRDTRDVEFVAVIAFTVLVVPALFWYGLIGLGNALLVRLRLLPEPPYGGDPRRFRAGTPWVQLGGLAYWALLVLWGSRLLGSDSPNEASGILAVGAILYCIRFLGLRLAARWRHAEFAPWVPAVTGGVVIGMSWTLASLVAGNGLPVSALSGVAFGLGFGAMEFWVWNVLLSHRSRPPQ